MKNQINTPVKFKTIGFIPLESFNVKTKNGKVKRIVKVYSNAILVGKEAFNTAKSIIARAKQNNVVKEHLKSLSIALDIHKYAEIHRIALLHLAKTRANKGLCNRIKNIWSQTIEYTKISIAKRKLKAIISKFNQQTREFMNDFFYNCPSLGVNLNFICYNLNIK